MCNRFGSKAKFEAYQRIIAQLRQTMSPSCAIPNLQPRDDIRPTDTAPIIRQVADGIEIKELRFGLIPYFHKGPAKDWKVLTTNARYEDVTETRSYKKAFASQRCLIPFTHFYEWTGEKSQRKKLKIEPVGDDIQLCFGGIWDRAETADGVVESFSILTRPAQEPIKAFHERQPLILAEDQYWDYMNYTAGKKSTIGYHLSINESN